MSPRIFFCLLFAGFTASAQPLPFPISIFSRQAVTNTTAAGWKTKLGVAGTNDLGGKLDITNGVAVGLAGTITNAVIVGGSVQSVTNTGATGSRVMVFDANGVATNSAVTATTLGFLDATSSIQTQIDASRVNLTTVSNQVAAMGLVPGYSLTATTTDATPTELLTAASARLTLPDATSWAFGALVLGRYAPIPGVTWTARDSARDWRGVASSSDGTKLVATVLAGQLYTSTDSGVTWTARESVRAWREVASSSDGVKLVATVAAGQTYTSTDTWQTESIQFTGQVSRDSGADTVTVTGLQTNPLGTNTWTFSCDADTSNGALRFQVTGEAGKTIKWGLSLKTVEVTN